MENPELMSIIESASDEELQGMVFPVSYSGSFPGNGAQMVDEEGFPIYGTGRGVDKPTTGRELQDECWRKFNTNPQISTAISDNSGVVCGKGFSITSPNPKVCSFIDQVMKDSRNRLLSNLKKFHTRSEIEGELFLAVTAHQDGFVEVDFMHPEKLINIYTHPTKTTMPLFYEFTVHYKRKKINKKTFEGWILIKHI